MRTRKVAIAILVGTFFASAVLRCSAAEPSAESQAIYQKTLKASTWVIAVDRAGHSHQGTGFMVDRSRRWMITNEHVVGDAKAVRVFFPMSDSNRPVSDRKAYIRSGGYVRGQVIVTDVRRDLAVIELQTMPDEAGVVGLASAPPGRGEQVFQIGNPGARQLWETNSGRIMLFTSVTPKDKNGTQRPTHGYWIREDSLSGPGYSGGPVVNARGLVVGVLTKGRMTMSPEFYQGLPQLSGLIASIPGGPTPFLASAPIKVKAPDPLAWCIDVREVEAMLTLVRQNQVKAQRVFNPRLAEDFLDRGLHYLEQRRPDVALTDFNEAAKRDSKIAHVYCYRAMAYRNLGDTAKALSDFQEAMNRDSRDPQPYRERAVLYVRQKEYARAIADFSEAIQREPKDEKVRLQRAWTYAQMGKFASAGEDFAEAVRLAPEDPKANNALAWHLATCPEKEFRDGRKALEHASRACELPHWKNATLLDTLAAAHAECGQFNEAVKWQNKALELAAKEQTKEFRQRLALYQSNKPYRQTQPSWWSIVARGLSNSASPSASAKTSDKPAMK